MAKKKIVKRGYTVTTEKIAAIHLDHGEIVNTYLFDSDEEFNAELDMLLSECQVPKSDMASVKDDIGSLDCAEWGNGQEIQITYPRMAAKHKDDVVITPSLKKQVLALLATTMAEEWDLAMEELGGRCREKLLKAMDDLYAELPEQEAEIKARRLMCTTIRQEKKCHLTYYAAATLYHDLSECGGKP